MISNKAAAWASVCSSDCSQTASVLLLLPYLLSPPPLPIHPPFLASLPGEILLPSYEIQLNASQDGSGPQTRIMVLLKATLVRQRWPQNYERHRRLVLCLLITSSLVSPVAWRRRAKCQDKKRRPDRCSGVMSGRWTIPILFFSQHWVNTLLRGCLCK